MLKHLLAAALVLSMAEATAQDGKLNHYKVTINAAATRAHIDADVWVEGNELALFNAQPIPGMKNGQADLLDKLVARDTAGTAIALTDKGEGEYALQGDRRITLSYDVRLEHDKYQWPGGNEEVSYHTAEGLMATGYALFLAPGVAMPGKTEVHFVLPPQWVARTPWTALAAPNTFLVESRRELLNNALFLGTARADTFKAGGIELTLVMGKRYWPQRANFMEMIERQLETYIQLFGGPPLASRYLIVINQGDTGDGGAFSGSFSQYLKKNGEKETRAIWGRTLAHEILHFWNGHTLVPKDGNEEWFKEGVTDYLTTMTMARNGFLDRDILLQFLENLPRGQVVARQLMGLKGTVREAVKDKHRNWLLVYGGGAIAALTIDVEMRKASGGKAGIEALMKALYAEFGKAGKTYTQADVVRLARQVSGAELEAPLNRIVASDTAPDLAPLFADLGMQLEQFGMLDTYLLRAKDAPKAAHQRFVDIFGISY